MPRQRGNISHSLPSTRGHRTAWQVTWRISRWEAEATYGSMHGKGTYTESVGACPCDHSLPFGGSEAWSQTQAQCTPRQRGNLWQHGKCTPSLSVLAHVITACRLGEATAQHDK